MKGALRLSRTDARAESSLCLKRFHVRHYAFGESIQPVAAFQHGHEPRVAEFVGQLHDHASQRGIAFWRDVELAEEIFAHAVEAGADKDEVGFEASDRWHELSFEGLKELRVACSWRHGHIQDLARSRSRPGFLHRAGSRVGAVIMRTEIKDGTIVVEDILRAIAVVIIPINNQNSTDSMLLLKIARSDGDIVEDAKPHAAIRCCVMPRRTYRGERIANFAGHDRINDIQYAAGSELGCFKRSW